MTLPKDIKELFYKTIQGNISLDEFEKWLYEDKNLEKLLRPEDYLDLISLNFKKGGAKYELWSFLKKHIDLGEFETYKMLRLLKEAQQKTERLPYILIEFYNLYCKGYGFFQDLGLGIGLAVEVPRVSNSKAENWDELTEQEQKELLDSFSPELEDGIERVIYWLETKKIILIGEQNEIGDFDYKDLRSQEEKKSKLWVTVSEDQKAGYSESKNILWDNKNNPWNEQINKKWWEFWK